MKQIVLLLLILVAVFKTDAQNSKLDDQSQIIEVINLFFTSLEAKDSALMRQTTMDEAQIWRRYSDADPAKFDFRFSKDDLGKMSALPDVREVASTFDIKVHNGLAVAWVPYEFWIEDKFSHCGVDVFTLFNFQGVWKIVSAAYSVEKDNCHVLKLKK